MSDDSLSKISETLAEEQKKEEQEQKQSKTSRFCQPDYSSLINATHNKEGVTQPPESSTTFDVDGKSKPFKSWTTVADEDDYLFNATFKGIIEESSQLQAKTSFPGSSSALLLTNPGPSHRSNIVDFTSPISNRYLKEKEIPSSREVLGELNDSTINNHLVNITSSQENFDFHSIEHADTSFPVFLELWENRQVCDVIISVSEREFHAHRVILCATIPYFHAMFTNDVVEKNQKLIVLRTETQLSVGDETTTPTLDARAFEALLRYAYTGSIQINSSNVQSILIGASFLGLTNVQQACADYLKVRLSVENVLNIIHFARALGSDSLEEASKRYIYRHFEEISRTAGFMNLDYEEVYELLQKDELNIRGEECVFIAAMTWIKSNQIERFEKLAQLLTCVRLPLLSPEYLTDIVMSEQLVRKNLECRDLIDEAKDYHLLPARRYFIQRFRLRPRFGHLVQGLIYAVGGLAKNGDSMSTVEVYDSTTRRWRIAEAMTMLRSRVGVAVMDGKLYAIGGYNGKERLNTVEVYDARLKRWNKVTWMTCKRSAVGAAALYGYLYVCGGYDGQTSLNVVERYSAQEDRWNVMTPMNCHRSAAGVVAFDGYIFVLGGHDGMMIFNSVERYDPRTNQWEIVMPMLTRRCRLGVTSFGGKIYVCGGYDGQAFLQTAEVYDPNTGQWSFIAPMKMTRSRVALVANSGKLYAIGGYDGLNNLSSVEVYDVDQDMWAFTASMAAHEGGVGVGVIPND